MNNTSSLTPPPEWSAVAEQAISAAKRLGVDEAEAYLSAHEMIEVGLEKGEVQLVRTASEQGLGLRVYRNRSLGFASANTFDSAAILEIAEGAAMQAKASPGDPGGELPEPVALRPVVGLADPSLRDVTVEQAVEMGRAALDAAMSADPRVRIDGGALVVYHGREGVISSRGVACADSFTAISLNLMGMAVDGESVASMDYDMTASRRAGAFDPAAFGREMGLGFLTALHPRHAKSFKGSVLFHPRAVAELILGALLGGACAETVQRGASPLAGKLGEKIAPDFFTLVDDGNLPGAYGSSSFDREGMPHERLALVENGVLKNFLYRHGSAVRDGRKSTGHASGGSRSAPATGTTNLIVNPGATPLAKLQQDLDYSLLVTRASGHPNPITGEFSCAVKGAQLIEKGEITGPVTEVMMRGNAFDLLKQISALSLEREDRPGLVCPWILIDGVDVTAA